MSNEEAEAYKQACALFAEYFWTELSWAHFRAEFLRNPVSTRNNNASSENAAIIMQALDRVSGVSPDVKALVMGMKT